MKYYDSSLINATIAYQISRECNFFKNIFHFQLIKNYTDIKNKQKKSTVFFSMNKITFLNIFFN